MIILDYRDRRPIYEQIVERFEELMATGALEEGSQLPSVRSLAMELSINPNTIQRAYVELERQGYVSLCAGKDQKEKRVFLTPEGRDFAADSLRELYAMEDRAVAAVGPERFREMVEANRAFTEAFEREVRNGTRK